MTARIAIGPLSAGHRREFVGSANVVAGFAVDPSAARSNHVVCEGDVGDAEQMADAFEAAMSGADLLITVSSALVDAVLADAARAGFEHWEPDSTPGEPEWVPLLDQLARGVSVTDAARQCFMSQRSAYRRLAEARDALGASSTTAAVAKWAAIRSTGGGWRDSTMS